MRTCILIAALSWGPLSCALAPGPRTADLFDDRSYASHDVITRDVAVIGGGSSGTYTAINLRALGKSVIVVEKNNRLGGHTYTYADPSTGVTINWGLQAIYNISAARDYLSLLGVLMGPFQPNPVTRTYADFKTGKPVSAPKSPGFAGYAEQLHKYPYLAYSWDLPSPVPEDLLLPFGKFLTKYNIEGVGYGVYFGGQGCTNILQQLTVNVFKMIDDSYLNSMTGAAMMPVSGNNGELYDKALAILGSDTLLSSTIVASKRSSNHGGVRLIVKSGSGRKLIKASKLVITIPPLLNNLAPFDLDSTERRLFSQWRYSNYFSMLVNNTGLPSGFQFANAVNSSAGTFSIPNLPAPYQITGTRIPGLFYVWYGSPHDMTEAEVKADVTAVIKRLRHTFNSTVTTPPTFVEFRSNTPFKLVVPAQAVTGGFYQELKARKY
ncbi:putative FAD dependent oxidoreductase [Parathielavia appendiculata]|uniref:FAD dependent oxidoreductase n=1 Tax=Parathielavia appendiculata TaxID=2587402 RepID=A0AAN6Z207_9PEZI|nr:putative FAD dependent oxidoreductase [Parathielavia appendiculata]